MDHKEVGEMSLYATIGAVGINLPTLQQASEFFSGITPIVSFFLIVIPTGIWAWCRALHFIKRKYTDKE